jgi:putative SOS response-associated peptidase YedK
MGSGGNLFSLPTTEEWERTFAIITVPSNELVRQIHNRMPAILKPESYDRWLGVEPDPYDLLITYPSEPITMWPISTRVNAPENDDPSLLDQVDEVAFDQKDLMRVSTVR